MSAEAITKSATFDATYPGSLGNFLSKNKDADSLKIRTSSLWNLNQSQSEQPYWRFLGELRECKATHLEFVFDDINTNFPQNYTNTPMGQFYDFARRCVTANPNIINISIKSREDGQEIDAFSFSHEGHKANHGAIQSAIEAGAADGEKIGANVLEIEKQITQNYKGYLKQKEQEQERLRHQKELLQKRLRQEHLDNLFRQSSDVGTLAAALSSAGDTLPVLFKDISEIYDKLPRDSERYLRSEYGYNQASVIKEKQASVTKEEVDLPNHITHENLINTGFLTGPIPKFYRAVEAGQFDKLLELICKSEGKLSLTPAMLLYRPSGFMSKKPSTVELLMQQGRLPQLFTKELLQYRNPFPLHEVVETLPPRAFENQVGTKRLCALINEISEENLDAAEQLAALVRERARLHLNITNQEIAAATKALEPGLAQMEGDVGKGVAQTAAYIAGQSPFSEVLPDGRIILRPPMNMPEAPSAPTRWGDHLSDNELGAMALPLMREIDKSPSAWTVPVGSEPINPVRELLRRLAPEGSRLHKEANKPPEQPDWQNRVEPDQSQRDNGKH